LRTPDGKNDLICPFSLLIIAEVLLAPEAKRGITFRVVEIWSTSERGFFLGFLGRKCSLGAFFFLSWGVFFFVWVCFGFFLFFFLGVVSGFGLPPRLWRRGFLRSLFSFCVFFCALSFVVVFGGFFFFGGESNSLFPAA